MAPNKKVKRSAKVLLSEEECTPKRLKAAEPDLTVVVGGVEFRHYKVILCAACDFFDTMLSAQMRENTESRVEFPDKDPNEWLEIYPFLDSTAGTKPAPITVDNAMKFISWFDYLGMAEKAAECDKVYANHYRLLPSGWDFLEPWADLDGFLGHWKAVRSKPCPVTHNLILDTFRKYLSHLKFTSGMTAADAAKIKKVVLDDAGGEKVWDVLQEYIHLPPQVKHSSRTVIAENPLFEHLLRTGHENLW